MAYCLRLPRDTVQLIEEMRRHWKGLAELKAAGGTPAARLIKTIRRAQEGGHLLRGEASA